MATVLSVHHTHTEAKALCTMPTSKREAWVGQWWAGDPVLPSTVWVLQYPGNLQACFVILERGTVKLPDQANNSAKLLLPVGEKNILRAFPVWPF